MANVRLLLLMGLVFAVTACSNLPPFPQTAAHNAQSLERALSGELFLGRHWLPEELPAYDLFKLTPEMREFAERAVSKQTRDFGRAEALQRALLLPVDQGGRGIIYSSELTETPAAAFAQRRVNCVSFTFMYVALARHVGLDAFINEVDLPPSWNLRSTDAFLFLRHINVKIKLAHNEEVVIDLEMDRYSSAYRQRHISEDLAAAQFYNNRGMELSAAGDVQRSFLYLRKALLLETGQSYIWNNFATLYRRHGFLPEAEAAYLHGLSLNADDLTIISNLAGLYRILGDNERANYYFARAEQHRDTNPYYHFSRANFALQEQRPDEALTLIREAIKQRADEPRFYELAADIYDQLGNAAAAAKMRKKMQGLQLPLNQRRES